MISDHLEDSAYIYLSLDQFETDVNLTIVNLCDSYKQFSFLAPFYGSLFSYTRIVNDAYPDVYYTMYYVNQTVLIPATMDSMVIKGYQELLVVFHVSVDSLLTGSQRLMSSRSYLNFTVF